MKLLWFIVWIQFPCVKQCPKAPNGRGSEHIDESAQESNEDVLMVGALDSACNRTCCGTQRLGGYLRQIHRLAPSIVSSLIESEDEQERLKFGNGGF